MDILKQFYENEVLRESVKAFMLEQLKEMAVERVFEDKDVTGLYEGVKVVDKMFDKLEEIYKVEKKLVIDSPR